MAESWDEDTTSTETAELTAVSGEHPLRNRPCLTVLTGTATGSMFKLPRGEHGIGRAQDALVRLIDDGVSRQHARVRLDTDQLWVEDLGSRNGTFVNGVRITDRTPLRDGDKIQVGRTTVLRFAYHDEIDESFHENLMSSALRDPLTRLFNKRYFLDRLDSELKFARRHEASVSLLMLDLDHFKKVNDTHGHLAGDAVLINLAGILTKAVRNEDVVARFGGEEVAIILRAIPLDPAIQLADRLRKLVEQTVTPFGGLELRATVSVGAAGYPTTNAETIEELITSADRALYRAKDAGRNRVSRLTLR
ncbi:MAG: diguanylate cyclase [Myxococcales bacterium]|nr:diguanylate cyclase [Myxococcales bacterium]